MLLLKAFQDVLSDLQRLCSLVPSTRVAVGRAGEHRVIPTGSPPLSPPPSPPLPQAYFARGGGSPPSPGAIIVDSAALFICGGARPHAPVRVFPSASSSIADASRALRLMIDSLKASTTQCVPALFFFFFFFVFVFDVVFVFVFVLFLFLMLFLFLFLFCFCF
jgi:hypothetical protein